MKAFVRLRFNGEERLHLGAEGWLTPGTEFSMPVGRVQYLKESRDGMPEYLEVIGSSEEYEEKALAKVVVEPTELRVAMLAHAELRGIEFNESELALTDEQLGEKLSAVCETLDEEEQALHLAKARAGELGLDVADLGDNRDAIQAAIDDYIPPYTEWTVDALTDELKVREIPIKSGLRKDDLVGLLEAGDVERLAADTEDGE